MKENLRSILEEYLKNVENVCSNLIREINITENLNLRNKYDFFMYRAECKKMEFEAKGIVYRLHGKGCTAFNGELFMDWDFGYRSRWCGIEPWKVSMTLNKSKGNTIGDFDENLIKTFCELSVKNNTMFEKSGQYYFTIPESETFKTDFPMEYDTLIIEHFDSRWILPRNKLIDRFIRKSSRVYNSIYKNENKYILRFFFREKEIYSIPYDDIGYPENAIKIMSDNIIWNLMKPTLAAKYKDEKLFMEQGELSI